MKDKWTVPDALVQAGKAGRGVYDVNLVSLANYQDALQRKERANNPLRLP